MNHEYAMKNPLGLYRSEEAEEGAQPSWKITWFLLNNIIKLSQQYLPAVPAKGMYCVIFHAFIQSQDYMTVFKRNFCFGSIYASYQKSQRVCKCAHCYEYDIYFEPGLTRICF